MTQQKSDPSFNITLSEFLASHLREDFCLPISQHLAETIDHIAHNKCIVHIQYADFYGHKLPQPMLWRYRYWVESINKFNIDKARSEAQRVAKYIFDENVKRVKKACINVLLMDDSNANGTAFCIVRHNNKTAIDSINMLGACIKLITTEDEL
jgi:hypothetical protein